MFHTVASTCTSFFDIAKELKSSQPFSPTLGKYDHPESIRRPALVILMEINDVFNAFL